MSDYEICDTGKWFDTRSETVVTERPEEGVQLVAPGGELSPDVKDTIARYEEMAADAGNPPAEEPAVEAPAGAGAGGKKSAKSKATA